MQTNILVTGGAGFIGSHLVDELLKDKEKNVFVIDNFDPFYEESAKQSNIQQHLVNSRYRLIVGDIRDKALYKKLDKIQIHSIVHIAAKAGVRPSIQNPSEYNDVNVGGTQTLLEFARENGIKQFVFASSSSVYGVNANTPWKESDKVLLPISPYASTKVSAELLGHVYSHLYGIRFLALRFFTVYGPRQRPDLAIYKFSKMLMEGDKVTMYGDGSTRRDYTYVGDIVGGILRALDYRESMYEVINLGNHQTISLAEMIRALEETYKVRAQIETLPEQAGDVPVTYADISKAKALLGYAPATSFLEGIDKFRDWYLSNALSRPVEKL
jgi:UDP-glucuronate 4-epimerase